MTKTNTGLIAYVKAKIGCYYWYGTFGQMASKALYNQKKAQYPKYYTATDFTKQIANPKQVFDCAGLVKAYLWTDSISDTTPSYNSKTDYSANDFYKNATTKGALPTSRNLKLGTLVFKGSDTKKTHVGVYIGNDQVIEAKGHAYGVVQTKFSTGGWKYYGECNLITYIEEKPVDPLAGKTDEQLAKEVIADKWGDGEARKKALGVRYEAVQKLVNQMLGISKKKTIDEIAKEVIDDKWGDGEARKKKLTEAGYNYQEVQNRVNEILHSKPEYYTIKKGDTLSAIAVKYKTTVQKIMELNHIKNANSIQIGQKIQVR